MKSYNFSSTKFDKWFYWQVVKKHDIINSFNPDVPDENFLFFPTYQLWKKPFSETDHLRKRLLFYYAVSTSSLDVDTMWTQQAKRTFLHRCKNVLFRCVKMRKCRYYLEFASLCCFFYRYSNCYGCTNHRVVAHYNAAILCIFLLF